MADKTDETDDTEEEEESGGKKKIFMIVGAVAVLGAVYQFVLKSPPPEETEADDEAAAAAAEPIEGEIVELEEMILNIGGEQTGYLRIGLAIVLQEGVLAEEFEAESAIAKDIAVQYLSARTSEELRSTEGRQAAKDELSQLVRDAYGEDRVVRVLFTALVMQ